MSRMIANSGPAPTEAQWAYVDGLRRKLHLTETLLSNHCVTRFQRPLKRLDRGQVSLLIDELKDWTAIPADLLRKPGQNAVPVVNGDITRNLWIEYANPTWPDEDRCAEGGAFATWYGIRETDTLNVAAAREHDDERHIAALQRETARRCIQLWSNAGETVLSPFAGIGTEGDQAIRLGRKAVLIELKPAYWRVGVANLRTAEHESRQHDLFSLAGVAV